MTFCALRPLWVLETTLEMWSLPDNDLVIYFDDFARYFCIRHLVSYGSVVEGAPEYTSFVWVELTIVLITPFVNAV